LTNQPGMGIITPSSALMRFRQSGAPFCSYSVAIWPLPFRADPAVRGLVKGSVRQQVRELEAYQLRTPENSQHKGGSAPHGFAKGI